MTPRDRVLAAIEHRPFDRLPVNYLGTPDTDGRLRRHFGIDRRSTLRPGDVGEDNWDILQCLGVDLRTLRLPYCGPEIPVYQDGRVQSYWGYIRKPIRTDHGVYMESCYLPWAEFQCASDLQSYRWPDPGWFDYGALPQQCRQAEDCAIVFGAPGNLDMINGTAFARGFEQTILDLATENPAGLACMERRFEFAYDQSSRALAACRGRVDILWIGDDFGTQRGLLVSPAKWRGIFRPKLRAMADLAHRHGARLMLHSCGSTRAIWPDLVEIGVDIYDTVQPEAAGMNPEELAIEFPSVCLHGTMSTQTTLPFGTTDEVRHEVAERADFFMARGGLILAPSHNIQGDTPLENVLAMYRAAGSLTS